MDTTRLDPTLQQLQSQLEALFAPFQAEVTAHKDEPILYRYTDDQGLRGILEHGTLWLSDVFSMNDPSEIRYGLRFGTDRVNKLINMALPEHAFFANVFNDFIDAGAPQSGHYSICCFGRADPNEDLGQWRAYADDGRGFALGFDTHALSTAFMNNGYPCPGTFPVRYQEPQLIRM